MRAVADVADDPHIVVVGSQAMLGRRPDAPAAMPVSTEADVHARSHPERRDFADGTLGEGSMFRDTFGNYAHGAGEETATAPAGWQDRLVSLRNLNTRGATGRCLEAGDLVLASVAGREILGRAVITKSDATLRPRPTRSRPGNRRESHRSTGPNGPVAAILRAPPPPANPPTGTPSRASPLR